MGGIGSGRPRRMAPLSDLASVTVRELVAKGLFEKRRLLVPFWQCRGLTLLVLQRDDDCIRCSYGLGDAGGTVTYLVRVSRTSCHFGGHRWWIHCAHLACQRRAAILYMDEKRHLICRSCTGHIYASQTQQQHLRRLERASAIRLRLGGGPNLLAPFPGRPARMRHATYQHLRDDARLNEARFLAECRSRAQRLASLNDRRW